MNRHKKDFFIIFHDEKNSKIRKNEITIGSLVLYLIILIFGILLIFSSVKIFRSIKKSINVSLSIQKEIDKLNNTEKILASLNDSINTKLKQINVIDSQIQTINSVVAPDLNKEFLLNKKEDSIYLNLDLKTHLLLVKDMEFSFIKIIKLYNNNNYLITNYPTEYPVKKIKVSRYYGLYKDPYTLKLKLHKGVDFLGNVGDTVYAVANGEISKILKNRYKGLFLIINHTDTLSSLYSHLDKVLKPLHKKVVKGEPIALLGNSGKSMFPHLHFEILEKDSSVNPMNYLIDSNY